jgi:hypothetical protein
LFGRLSCINALYPSICDRCSAQYPSISDCSGIDFAVMHGNTKPYLKVCQTICHTIAYSGLMWSRSAGPECAISWVCCCERVACEESVRAVKGTFSLSQTKIEILIHQLCSTGVERSLRARWHATYPIVGENTVRMCSRL